MTRGHFGWIALGCLALGGCASRKEGTDMPPAPPPAETSQAPAAAAADTPQEASLRCELSGPASQKAGEPVELTFRLTNTTAQPVSVLKWHTPLEGLKNNFLEVKRGGAEVPYQGPMFKRGEPSAGDYVPLAPGASVEQKFEASLAYDFSQPGTYVIAFPGPLMDVATQQDQVPRPLAEHRAVPVQCPTLQLAITPP